MSRKPAPNIQHPYVFSVSQAETFELCNRKWGFLKIDKLQDPGSDASILGGKVHDCLEAYLERGEPIPGDQAGRIAMAAVPYLPTPQMPGMKIEEWFHLRVGNAYYRGLKDVEIPGGWRSARPFVSDHKTTKNFMWAKTADDLTGGLRGVGNTQAGVYAGHTMKVTGERHVDLQWTYMRTTSSPLAQPTYAVISDEQVNRVIEKLEKTTERMIWTKDNFDRAMDIEPNYKGCPALGGCPFRDRCERSAGEVIKSLFSRDRLLKQKKAEAPERKRELRETAERLVPLSRKNPRDVTHLQAAREPTVKRAAGAFASALLDNIKRK